MKQFIAVIWLMFHPLMKQLFFALYQIGKFRKKVAEIKQIFPDLEESSIHTPFFGRPNEIISTQFEWTHPEIWRKSVAGQGSLNRNFRTYPAPPDLHQTLFALTVSSSGGTNDCLRNHIIAPPSDMQTLMKVNRFTAPRSR